MIKTTALAVAIATLLCWVGPSLDDHSAEWDESANLAETLRAADSRKRFERAAQQICGPQSPFTELADGSIQCHDRRGRKTITAEVRP